MKHLRKLAISGFLVCSLITLSSCSFLSGIADRFGNSTTVNTTPDETTTSESVPTTVTTTDLTTPSISTSDTSTPSSTTSTIIDTPIEVTNLDYGYLDLEHYDNSDNLKLLYGDLNNALGNFYTSTIDITPETYSIDGVDSEYYVIREIEYSKYNIEDIMAYVTLKNVLLDHPEYYFVSNEVLSSTSGSTKKIIVLADSDYALSSNRLEYNTKIEEFKTDAIKDFTDETTVKEKVKAIHDYIISHAEYALDEFGQPSSTSFAHNLLGIVVEGKGVCESYTELLTYILKSLEIPAITVSGKGYTSAHPTGEAHAWNYVHIDGYYYAFDVTWNDTAHTNDYYGLSYQSITKMEDDHVTDGSHIATIPSVADGIRYLYNLPELSTIDLKDRI